MCSPSLSLLAERKYASDSDSDSREWGKDSFPRKRKRFIFLLHKKEKVVDLFFVRALKYHELLARIEQKHATTITTNEQHKVVPRVHSYSSFTLPHSLFLFAFVSVYLILISVVTVVELTRSVVRLSEFVYAVIAWEKKSSSINLHSSLFNCLSRRWCFR